MANRTFIFVISVKQGFGTLGAEDMRCQNIPVLMAIQHPDSTIYVSAFREVNEAVDIFTKYASDEIMVDYKGRLTPYHQPDWIINKLY